VRLIFFAAPALVWVVAVSWSAPFEGLFSRETAAELEASGGAKRTFRGAEGLALFPRLAMRDEVSRRVAALVPTVGVEMAVSYRPPDGPAGGDARTIYNALHAVSSLKGVEYFSVSRGRVDTLFHDAAFIDSAAGNVRLPDPRLDAAPADDFTERRFASFDDASFGRYVVEVVYQAREGVFVLSMENVGAIRKLLIPFVQPRELLSTIIVMPLEDQIVLYGFSCVHALNVFGLAERIGAESFSNRLAALMRWFQATYQATYSGTRKGGSPRGDPSTLGSPR
jgi:hypothetical protein